jgi:single-strand DNA-binding protein
MAKATTAPKATDIPAAAPKAGPLDLNSVALVGRLTTSVVLRETPSGRSVASLRIAVFQRGGRVSFQTITVWGKLAEICAQHLTKGRLISVSGRLDSRDWVATDGTKRSAVSVTAFQVQFLDRKPADIPTEVGA